MKSEHTHIQVERWGRAWGRKAEVSRQHRLRPIKVAVVRCSWGSWGREGARSHRIMTVPRAMACAAQSIQNSPLSRRSPMPPGSDGCQPPESRDSTRVCSEPGHDRAGKGGETGGDQATRGCSGSAACVTVRHVQSRLVPPVHAILKLHACTYSRA